MLGLQEAEEKQSRQQMSHTQSSTQGGKPDKLFNPLANISDISSANASELPPEEWQPSTMDDFMEWGIRKYVEHKGYENLATNQRIFFDTVVSGNKANTPITEKDFKQSELKEIKRLLKTRLDKTVQKNEGYFLEISRRREEVEQNPKKGWTDDYKEYVINLSKDYETYKKTGKVSEGMYRAIHPSKSSYWEQYIRREAKTEQPKDFPNVIQYEDYAPEEYQVRGQRRVTDHDDTSVVHTTLGQFVGDFDPEKQSWSIKEKYDFNRMFFGMPTSKAPQYEETALESGTPVYNFVRTYAGRKAGAGSTKYTRDVEINLNENTEE